MGTPRKCPDCGTKLVPIVFGMPGPELFDQAQQGNVILGGCCMMPINPTRGCTKCGWEYMPPPNDEFEEQYLRELLSRDE